MNLNNDAESKLKMSYKSEPEPDPESEFQSESLKLHLWFTRNSFYGSSDFHLNFEFDRVCLVT